MEVISSLYSPEVEGTEYFVICAPGHTIRTRFPPVNLVPGVEYFTMYRFRFLIPAVRGQKNDITGIFYLIDKLL